MQFSCRDNAVLDHVEAFCTFFEDDRLYLFLSLAHLLEGANSCLAESGQDGVIENLDSLRYLLRSVECRLPTRKRMYDVTALLQVMAVMADSEQTPQQLQDHAFRMGLKTILAPAQSSPSQGAWDSMVASPPIQISMSHPNLCPCPSLNVGQLLQHH